MDFFKATNGQVWYLSIDGGATFERCQREPFLADKLAAPADEIPLHENADYTDDESMSREQVEERGFAVSKVTLRGS